jgi:hypothetical protein
MRIKTANDSRWVPWKRWPRGAQRDTSKEAKNKPEHQAIPGKRDEKKIAHLFNAHIQLVPSICWSSGAQESVPVVCVGIGVPDRAG